MLFLMTLLLLVIMRQQLSLHGKANGIYLLKLQSAEKVQTFKVLLQH